MLNGHTNHAVHGEDGCRVCDGVSLQGSGICILRHLKAEAEELGKHSLRNQDLLEPNGVTSAGWGPEMSRDSKMSDDPSGRTWKILEDVNQNKTLEKMHCTFMSCTVQNPPHVQLIPKKTNKNHPCRKC